MLLSIVLIVVNRLAFGWTVFYLLKIWSVQKKLLSYRC